VLGPKWLQTGHAANAPSLFNDAHTADDTRRLLEAPSAALEAVTPLRVHPELVPSRVIDPSMNPIPGGQ